MSFIYFMFYLSSIALDSQNFLDHYWHRPLPSQGSPSATLNSLESALEPQACQNCHPTQFSQWQQSRHARALGAGVIGQLMDMTPEEQQSCLNCHAPLAEQFDSLSKATQSKLHEQGVICSACHVRHYQWFGPPRRSDLPPLTASLPHNGWQSHLAFTDSRFCAACHQFPEDGYALNGKLLENTYHEWQASPQAQQGKTCQFCHVPNRQHLWRGIHDAAMVLSGVEIHASSVSIQEKTVRATLSLQNTQVGHFFPTYVTPRVVLEGYQETATGKKLADSVQQKIIAWSVSLDLTTEVFDTRLAPQQTAVLEYHAPVAPQATTLVLRIVVEPEAFYTRFYQSLLASQSAKTGLERIRQAMVDSQATQFVLYCSRLNLEDIR
ncbi:MAG: hypothetical protein BWK79_05200 [Beggiatoa sp. IS2]|nr:MAG: hypothetical protein BWK79_05200 [Beggiatoa sp. IS2]